MNVLSVIVLSVITSLVTTLATNYAIDRWSNFANSVWKWIRQS